MAGRTFALNRKARFEYDILETHEAGLVLEGTEIKAIREGRANIADAYARPERGEMWLVNAHIGQYSAGGSVNHDPKQPRKLLLHKDQAANLIGSVTQKGLSIVPLRLYIRNHVAKVELGLVRGKRQYDKRRSIIDRDREREAQRSLKRVV